MSSTYIIGEIGQNHNGDMRLARTLISEAAKNLSPAIIANYLYELVKLYNHFYPKKPTE